MISGYYSIKEVKNQAENNDFGAVLHAISPIFCAVFMLISALSGETIVAGKCEVGSILS